jgi:UDP-N-acetylmuramate--alanine ligase
MSIRPYPIANIMSLDVGVLHLVGIGGIGMSGIAEVLATLGYKVQGSDIADSYTLNGLRARGVRIMIGHAAENIEGAAVVVISSAVKADNPEVMAARAQRIPVVRRAEMLAELMRLKTCISIAGTHGKTTTTSLVATLLSVAQMNPTVINGGIINALGTNAVMGSSDWMVVEADESDGTFIRIPSTIAVVTNIDPEHLDHYGTFENAKAAFRQFLEQLPFYGFGVLCIDHPEVQLLAAKITDRRIVTYGTNPQADVRAVNIRQNASGQVFDCEIIQPHSGERMQMTDVHLPMWGMHNVLNSLAAIAVAQNIGIDTETILKALAGFGGVKRRFTKTGEVRGITIIDDYGHHPVEIAATLSSARQAVQEGGGRVIAVVQPHRYSRLSALFEEFCTCFNQADSVLVADVYSAGEAPIEGASRDALVEGIRNHGHKQVMALESEQTLAVQIAALARAGDFVICLGAGSISKWAGALPEQLESLMTT